MELEEEYKKSIWEERTMMRPLETELGIRMNSRQLDAEHYRKLILKLRWLGLEEEAERMRVGLPGALSNFCVLIEAQETD
jgi:hypothetical protein